MIQQIIEQVEESINQQVKEKFGLSDDQSTKTKNVFRETMEGFLDKNNLKNPQLFQSLTENFSSLQENETIVKLKEVLSVNLQEKAGLSKEKAEAIRDFSVLEFFKTLSSEFTDENGKLDIQKALNKLNMESLEQTAKSILGNLGDLGGLFKK